jgi:hypothetical protein
VEVNLGSGEVWVDVQEVDGLTVVVPASLEDFEITVDVWIPASEDVFVVGWEEVEVSLAVLVVVEASLRGFGVLVGV